jgi:hypothetical protein
VIKSNLDPRMSVSDDRGSPTELVNRITYTSLREAWDAMSFVSETQSLKPCWAELTALAGQTLPQVLAQGFRVGRVADVNDILETDRELPDGRMSIYQCNTSALNITTITELPWILRAPISLHAARQLDPIVQLQSPDGSLQGAYKLLSVECHNRDHWTAYFHLDDVFVKAWKKSVLLPGWYKYDDVKERSNDIGWSYAEYVQELHTPLVLTRGSCIVVYVRDA